MKVIWAVIVSSLCISMCSLIVSAQSNGSIAPFCSSAAMDVHALPPDLSAGQNKHLFVLEVQNIGKTACTLGPPIAELLPPPNPFGNFFLAGLPNEEEYRNALKPRRFEPGEWAHLVFIWDSRSNPEVVCYQYSGIKLQFEEINPNVQIEGAPPLPSIDIRNLWIRACGPVYGTGYREGRYVNQDSLLKYWFNPFKTSESETVDTRSFAKLITASEILGSSPLFEFHSPINRVMLGRHPSLRLNFPHGADVGCAFRILRERESSGATIISVQQCTSAEGASERPAWQPSASGIALIVPRFFHMLPQEPGSVEYEAVGAVAPSGAMRFARAQIKLAVHDPTLPGQAEILASLPPCKASQLHLVAHELVVSTKTQSLNAYEATNISDQACSLAGVPALTMLSEHGFESAGVDTCPNCDNNLFKVRPNGFIDLKHGETAHFLVGATGMDTQVDGRRDGPLNFRLTLTKDEQPVVLPMAPGAREAIDISAWRAGPFDNDPLNEQWAKTHDAVFQEPSSPLPVDCDKPELLTSGRPSMVPSKGTLARGFSLASHTFVKGESVQLHQWFDNSSDNPVSENSASGETCLNLNCFNGPSFDLYDAYGHRVLNKIESERRKKCPENPEDSASTNRQTLLWVPVEIPPRTCVNKNYVQLDRQYDLPPGEYTVHIRTDSNAVPINPCDLRQDLPFVPTPGKDLTFDVLQP